MGDINRPEGDNLGGILRFKFIDVNDVLSIALPINSAILSTVQLKPGKSWSSGYGTLETIGYSEPGEITDAGTIYKRMFVAFCPYENAYSDDLLHIMRNRQFLVDYTNANGVRKLIGSINEPLFFLGALNTKTKSSDLAGYSISFFSDSSHKAYVYSG
ncbi:MAG: hypothetical protein V4608_03300 [Bacteroidota bacterium]